MWRLYLFCIIFSFLFSCDETSNPGSQTDKENNKLVSKEQHAQREKKIISPKEIPSKPRPNPSKFHKSEQNSIYKDIAYSVISPNGLRMRAGPSVDDEFILLIPYLDTISIVDRFNFKRDTLNKVTNPQQDYSQTLYYQTNIIGDWLKVKYLDTVGFVFSAYISNNFSVFPIENYVFNYINRSVENHTVHHPSTKWYVLDTKENGVYLKPVTVNYRREHNLGWRYNPFYTYISENIRAGILYGLPQEPKSLRLESVHSGFKIMYDSLHMIWPTSTKLKKESEANLSLHNFTLKKIDNEDGIELVLSIGDINQRLEVKAYKTIESKFVYNIES